MSDFTSLTWSAHVRILFQQYNLADPVALLHSQIWSKERWKVYSKTAVAAYHETNWRQKTAALSGILTTQEVLRSRIHIKMLSREYLCYSYLGSDRNQATHCRLCQSAFPCHPAPTMDMTHLQTICLCTADTRTRMIPDLLNVISMYFPTNEILVHPNNTHQTQPHSTFLSLSVSPLTQAYTKCWQFAVISVLQFKKTEQES